MSREIILSSRVDCICLALLVEYLREESGLMLYNPDSENGTRRQGISLLW